MGDVGATHISDALMVNSTLTSVSVSRSHIRDAGATQLSQLLRVNTSLRVLYIRSNPINDLGMTRLQETMIVNSTIFRLETAGVDSSWNEFSRFISRKGKKNRFEHEIHRISNQDPSLTELSYRGYPLNHSEIRRLNEALIPSSTVTFLDLMRCAFSHHEVARLCEGLKLFSSLVSLNLNYNYICDVGAGSLLQLWRSIPRWLSWNSRRIR